MSKELSLRQKLENMSAEKLRTTAKLYYIAGCSKLQKDELVEKLFIFLTDPKYMAEYFRSITPDEWHRIVEAAKSGATMTVPAWLKLDYYRLSMRLVVAMVDDDISNGFIVYKEMRPVITAIGETGLMRTVPDTK